MVAIQYTNSTSSFKTWQTNKKKQGIFASLFCVFIIILIVESQQTFAQSADLTPLQKVGETRTKCQWW